MPWPMHRRVERQATRMHEMMERLEVDPRVLTRLRSGEAYAEARSRCLTCGTTERCLRWLEEQQGSVARPEFCPNLRLFETCRRADPSRVPVEMRAG